MELLARRGDSQDFSDNSSLLVSGRLQSIDAVEIAVFLEDAFGINFAETGFDQDTVDSVVVIFFFIRLTKRDPPLHSQT